MLWFQHIAFFLFSVCCCCRERSPSQRERFAISVLHIQTGQTFLSAGNCITAGIITDVVRQKKEKSANGDYTRNSVATVNRSHYQILFTTCSRSTTFPPLSTRPVRLVWFLRYLSPHIEIRTMMTEWVSATNTKQDSRLCWVCVLAPSRVISWRWSGRQ